jgi:hypothetical protein
VTTETDASGAAPGARWDGRRVLFDVQHGQGVVECAISPEVLRGITARAAFKPKDVLQSFMAAQAEVTAIVHGKLRRRALHATPLTVWTSDVEDLAEEAAAACSR